MKKKSLQKQLQKEQDRLDEEFARHHGKPFKAVSVKAIEDIDEIIGRALVKALNEVSDFHIELALRSLVIKLITPGLTDFQLQDIEARLRGET
jgi:hypothetical protein